MMPEEQFSHSETTSVRATALKWCLSPRVASVSCVLLVNDIYIHGDQHGFGCVAQINVIYPLKVRPVNSTVLTASGPRRLSWCWTGQTEDAIKLLVWPIESKSRWLLLERLSKNWRRVSISLRVTLVCRVPPYYMTSTPPISRRCLEHSIEARWSVHLTWSTRHQCTWVKITKAYHTSCTVFGFAGRQRRASVFPKPALP
jgi:hypothetical protein